MTTILGINAFHADSAAALLIDGVIVSAIEEERLVRTKHAAGFPLESIRWILSDSGLSISDIHHIAINTNPKSHRLRKIIYTLLNRPDPQFILQKLQNRRQRVNIDSISVRPFLTILLAVNITLSNTINSSCQHSLPLNSMNRMLGCRWFW